MVMNGECPLLAQSGHYNRPSECPLSRVKRTSPSALHMSAFDPKRTLRVATECHDFCQAREKFFCKIWRALSCAICGSCLGEGASWR